MSALGKGPGGGGGRGGGRGGGGFRGGGGQRMGGGMRMGGGHHHGGHGGWGRRGWGWGGWSGGWGPGFIDYYSYSPCDECWGQPPALYLSCMRYYGCPLPGSALYGLGQTTPASVSIPAAAGLFAVWGGMMWWLSRRRKKG